MLIYYNKNWFFHTQAYIYSRYAINKWQTQFVLCKSWSNIVYAGKSKSHGRSRSAGDTEFGS